MGYTYGDFKERHPKYTAGYWAKLRAFYSGGRDLLENHAVLCKVFPRHNGEEHSVYEERCERAQYTPYPGAIVEKLVASAAAKPLTMDSDDEFYQEFFANCAPKDGTDKISVNDLVTDALREAMIVQTQWTLIDMPQPESEPTNRLEQEQMGALDAYCVNVPAEKVINWEETKAGKLVCVLMVDVEDVWGGLGTKRGDKKYIFTYYTATSWEKWSIVWEKGQEPKDSDPMTSEGSGQHPFGRVPWVRLQLPAGLWVLDKIESMIRAWFNKRNALDWSQYKNLLPVMYATIAGNPEMDPDASEATQRLLNQKAGPGKLMVLGEKDTVGFAAPDPAVYQSIMDDLTALRDEMYRVHHSMADSVDNSGAALQRSAESKTVDQQSTSIILKKLGDLGRKFVEEILDVVSAGRGEKDPGTVVGMDEYDDCTAGDLVTQAVNLEAVVIPSPTFQQLTKLRLAKSILGKDATEEQLQKIQKELEQGITAESLAPPDPNADTGQSDPGF